ncbi:MAG: cadherin-like beta sandwich domain-containing protein, partial [Chromatiales bacterium]|nr:cadherin-like beta sandwich domain-containing protein [Chromatiales bacterium]
MRIINYSIGLILLVLLVQSSAYGQFTFVPSRFQYDASPFCSSCNPEDGILHWYFDLDSIRIIDATESESAKFQITIQNRFSRTVSTSALNQRVEALSMAISSNIDAFADLENSCEVEFSSNFLSVSDGGRLNNSYSVIISNAFFGGNASAISINMLAADFFNLFRTPFVDRDQIVSVGARPQDTYTLICDIENTDQEAGFAFNASVVFEGSSFRLYTDPFSNAFDDVIQRPASQLADNDLRGFRLDGKTWAKDYARYGDGTGVRLRFSEGIQTQLNTQNFVVLDTSDAPLVIDGSTVTIASVEHIADESYANVVLSSAVSGGILRLVSTATNVVIDARGETLANDNFLASLEYDADAPRVIVVSEPISTLTTAEQQIVDADSSNNYSVRAITFSSPISVATIDEGDICVTATPNGSCVTGDTPAVANIDGGSEPMTTTIRVLINEGDGKTEISGGSLEFRRNAILGADYRVVEDYQQPLRGIIDIADTQPPVIAITGAEATADDNNLLLYTITFTVTADEPVPTLNDIDSYTLLRLLTDGSVTVEITPATQSISGNDRRAMLEYTYTFADEDALRNTAGFVLARSSDTTLVDTGGLSPEIGPNGGLDPSNDDAVAVERADTSLRNLVVSEGTLNPDFNSKTLSYTVSVANMTTMITVMPTASDADVISITVNGDAVDSDNASIAIDLTGGG